MRLNEPHPFDIALALATVLVVHCNPLPSGSPPLALFRAA